MDGGIVADDFENVLDHFLLDTLHGVGLATAGLAICEASDHPLIEKQVYQRSNHVFVKVVRCLLFAESIVKLEFAILYVFCYSVHFCFAFVHSNYSD